MSQATVNACQSAPDSANCVRLALIDINAARHSEGVGPMHLPGRFRALTRPQQLMVLSNLERIGRGLPAILGLTSRLDRAARRGALNFGDPVPPSNWYTFSNGYSSNFAYGFNSTLEADFEWMYDDGVGSGNLDCTSSDQSGCWGHRHDILWHFSAPIAMGAGYGTGQYGPSMTELFVGGDTRTGPGQPDAPVVRPSSSGASGAAAGGNPVGTVAGQSTGHRPAHVRVKSVTPAGRAVRLVASCVAGRGAICRLTVTVAPRHAGSKALVATRTLTIAAGRTSVIHVSLTAAARRLLSAHRKLAVRIVVKPAGKSALLSRTLTL
jgi:hypothetical protein